jgi:hypothetical protein
VSVTRTITRLSLDPLEIEGLLTHSGREVEVHFTFSETQERRSPWPVIAPEEAAAFREAWEAATTGAQRLAALAPIWTARRDLVRAEVRRQLDALRPRSEVPSELLPPPQTTVDP